MVQDSLAPKYKLPIGLPLRRQYCELGHTAGTALTSDWSVNSCIMVAYDGLFSHALEKNFD